VVRNGRVIGTGFHRRAGEPHAEIEALQAAGRRVAGGTLFVTLEPCAHRGRTPPCTDSILAACVRRVVVGCRDPNPHVPGGGVERLRRAGVKVDVGIEAESCSELIAAFAKQARTGLPLVTLKLAASLDGRIATITGDSRWITGESARRLVHRMRNQVDAVMVGAGTVIADDPDLTCRIAGGRDPLRVIVDGRLRIPLRSRVVTKTSAPGTLIATVSRKRNVLDTLRRRGATVLVLPGRNGRLSLRRLLSLLGKRGVMSVMIEGGASLAAEAIREAVVDRVMWFYAPMLIGGDGRPMLSSLGLRRLAEAKALQGLRVYRVGSDLLVRADLGGRHGVQFG
jgi:diaminohydroxyphosphoribosylaminopyrimidine deaminase/5-amino-6-(5-phosphoribosylamino)uracil reductase